MGETLAAGMKQGRGPFKTFEMFLVIDASAGGLRHSRAPPAPVSKDGHLQLNPDLGPAPQ